MNRHRAFVAARWLLAGALGAWTARQFYSIGQTVDPSAGALHGFYMLAGLLGTVALVAPELVDWAVVPLNRLIDAVLLPGETGIPPADYTLARFYVQQLRYDEAVEEYFKIIHYHPRELPAYLEGMLTAGQAQQIPLIEKIHRMGRRAFRNAKIRAQLHAVLENSRLAAVVLADMPDEENSEAIPPEPPAAPSVP